MSFITVIFNPEPVRAKTFSNVSYEGSNGWEVRSLISTATGRDVNPSTTSYEREDIGKANGGDNYIFYMPKLIDPVGKSKDDYQIFSELSKKCLAAGRNCFPSSDNAMDLPTLLKSFI